MDVKFVETKFNALVVGGAEVHVDPSVVTLASQAAIDGEIRAYLRCLATKRDGFTAAQANYFDEMSLFMTTKPTPQDFLAWKAANKFPDQPNDGGSALVPPKQRFVVCVAVWADQERGGLSVGDSERVRQYLESLVKATVRSFDSKCIQVLDRDSLNELVRELELQNAGLIDEATAIRVGKMTGANTLIAARLVHASMTNRESTVTGQRTVVPDARVEIAVNACDLETGKVIGSFQTPVTGHGKQILTSASPTRSRDADLFSLAVRDAVNDGGEGVAPARWASLRDEMCLPNKTKGGSP